MTELGSNDSIRGKKEKVPRRVWTSSEEDVLIAALKELVANGYKTDNGFCPGYMRHLEDAMKAKFPTRNIKGDPHINSKMTAWKKNYSSLTDILKHSGVGFNLNGDFMVDADSETWEIVDRV